MFKTQIKKETYEIDRAGNPLAVKGKTAKVKYKKLKKGTYKLKVNVKAAGNANYKASAVKKVTFKVKVR